MKKTLTRKNSKKKVKSYKKTCVACLPSKNNIHTLTTSKTAQWLLNLGTPAIPEHTLSLIHI